VFFYCQFYTLLEEEPNSRMSEDKARLYFQQIIMAIDYCHKLNILHRDLKPENILLDKTNNCIKISDFGLAQSINSKDEIISDIAGTTSYLAPEVIKQTGYTGQSADIWSTGVILFNCVTGTFPFFSKEPGNLINVILEGNVRYPEYLSTEIVDLLKKIFVVNPKYRFNVEQIIEHPWFQK
jgi:serine/threonine protein kinase